MPIFKASDYGNTYSDLRIQVDDEPDSTGAMYIHKNDECILVLQKEEFAAMDAAFHTAMARNTKWHAQYKAIE